MISRVELKVFISLEKRKTAYFQDQYEAKMFKMKLLRVLKGHCNKTGFEKNLKPNASDQAKLRNKQHAWEKYDELKMSFWCEIIQPLDKLSDMFVRIHKEYGPKAWDVICDRYKSCERPRLQQLIVKLTKLKMIAIESVIEYITWDEKLQSNLREVDEISEPMLISIILKGLKDDLLIL